MIVERIALGARLAAVSLALMSGTVAALELDDKQMQLLMEQLQEVQGCVGELEPGALAALQSDGEALMAEVGTLCRAGKRDEAQARALAFGRQFETSAEMQQLLTCAKRMGSVLPMLVPSAAQLAENGQVCDLPLE